MDQINFDVYNTSGRRINLPKENFVLPTPYTSADYGNIRFKDTGTLQNYVNVYLTDVREMKVLDPVTFNPILAIDQYLWVQGDIMTYGFFNTTSDPDRNYVGGGAILIGHGYPSSTDPPKIILTDNGYPTLRIQYLNDLADMKMRNMTVDFAFLTKVAADPPSGELVDGQMWFWSDV